jgi:hypothetical protein
MRIKGVARRSLLAIAPPDDLYVELMAVFNAVQIGNEPESEDCDGTAIESGVAIGGGI